MAKSVSPHGARKTKEELNQYGLTALQEEFCHAYLVRFSITKTEASLKLPKGTGNRWMQEKAIRERIMKLRLEAGTAFDLTKEALLTKLMNIVHADFRKLNDDIVKWPDDDADAVAEITYNLLGGVEKVKRWDVLRAIEILNKMLGYNTPDVTKVIPGDVKPMDKAEVLEIAKQLRDLI